MDDNSSLTGLLAAIFAKAGSSAGSAPLQTASNVASTSNAAAASSSSNQGTASLLGLVRRAQSQIDSLSLISDNDTIEDLPTSSLRAVLLGSIHAQVLGQSHTPPGDFAARVDVLRQSKDKYRAFLSQLLALQILDPRSGARYMSTLAKQAREAITHDRAPFPDDAAGRRAAKIASMRLERALTSALDAYRTAARSKAQASGSSIRSTTTGLSTGSSSTSARDVPETQYDLLVLPRRAQSGDEDEEDEDSANGMVANSSTADENGVTAPTTLRSYLQMLCHLHALHALSALDGAYTELQLLANMPQDHALQSRERAAREEAEARRRTGPDANDDWRIEQRWGASNDTPLLDDKGKPMRPFTILPGQGNGAGSGSNANGAGTMQAQMDQRQRLRQQVFQPSHRLPTMSIDEYLAEEERRGNIIQGGGQASLEAPTTKETLALRSEGGGGVNTTEAEEAEEEQRRKAIDWDEFSEANPKGMGNTMNRG